MDFFGGSGGNWYGPSGSNGYGSLYVGDFFLVVLAKVPRGGLAGDHALVYLFLFFIFFRKLRV